MDIEGNDKVEDIERLAKKVGRLERRFERVPEDRVRDEFYAGGWKRQKVRKRMIKNYIEPQLRKVASEAVPTLRAFGDSYRSEFIDRIGNPDFPQMRLFD